MPVLIGGHTNCNSPLDMSRFCCDGHQLVAPSRPGYENTPSSTGKSAESFAGALVGLLDQRHLERLIVVGISAAGPTALQPAGRHAERVSRLILKNAVTGGRLPAPGVRFDAYIVFNPWVERSIWAAFRLFARAAPRNALQLMLGSLTISGVTGHPMDYCCPGR